VQNENSDENPERKDGPAPIELGQEAEQLDEQAAFVRTDFEEPRGEREVWKVCQDQHHPVVLPGLSHLASRIRLP